MISAFFDYLRYELNRSPLTLEAYKNDIRQFESWISPDNPEATDFTSVTSNDIRAWLASLAKAGLNTRSIRRKIIALRTLFRWMLKNGVIKHSPVNEVPLPKLSKPLPDIIKPQEIEEALEALKRHYSVDSLNIQSPENGDNEIKTSMSRTQDHYKSILNELIVDMLYSLGLRRAELIALNDSDISFTKGEIKVTGKRSKQRIVPAPQKLLDKIKEWQILRDKTQETSDTNSPLFIIKGKRISAGQVYKIVTDTLAGVSARKKSPHALRHSFASGMLNGGADIDSVREFLGHASLATTQIYTHISLNEIKKAYNLAHPRSSDTQK